jgi:hypothetical protein
VRLGQRIALRVGDRDDGHVMELTKERPQLGHVEASVQRRQVRDGKAPGDWEMEIRHVEVHDVEPAGELRDLFQHQQVRREGVLAAAVEA